MKQELRAVIDKLQDGLTCHKRLTLAIYVQTTFNKARSLQSLSQTSMYGE